MREKEKTRNFTRYSWERSDPPLHIVSAIRCLRIVKTVGSLAAVSAEPAAQRLFRLHSPDMRNASSVNFDAMKNLLFPGPVLFAVENDQVTFIGAAAIHIADVLLKPFTDQFL